MTFEYWIAGLVLVVCAGFLYKRITRNKTRTGGGGGSSGNGGNTDLK